MAESLAALVILCLIADWVLRKFKVPGLIGFLLLGVLFGPSLLGLVDPDLLAIASDLRLVALIVILLRAGLTIRRSTLHQVGLRAILLSCIPALLEGGVITVLGPVLFGLSYLESAILGSVVAAVSPAVVVPMMLSFQEKKLGHDKHIPTLVLAGASLDDVNVIVVHGLLLGLYVGQHMSLAWRLASAPVSVVLGVCIGLAAGVILYRVFDRFAPRASKQVLTVLALSVLLVQAERLAGSWIPFAPLLAVMSIGFIVLERREHLARQLSTHLAHIWVFAEIVLFALAGAQVDVALALSVVGPGLGVIAAGLTARAAGVLLCLIGGQLTWPERLFVALSYTPKATVQAAIGAGPLLAMRATGMDTGPGEVILAVSVLSILATAPLGAWAISSAGHRILRRSADEAPDPAGAECHLSPDAGGSVNAICEKE